VIAEQLGFGSDAIRHLTAELSEEVSGMLVAMMKKLHKPS
jgi:hypothetical protein